MGSQLEGELYNGRVAMARFGALLFLIYPYDDPEPGVAFAAGGRRCAGDRVLGQGALVDCALHGPSETSLIKTHF